jgi:AcrR family transcriptional regulator
MLTEKKLEKRKLIASSCCKMFVESGFDNISISKIAQNAGIGKGTVYEYFKNKEDIVFELMTCLQETYDAKFQDTFAKAKTKSQKVLTLFDFFINDDEEIQTLRAIYKQFLIVCLTNPSEEIINYNTNLRDKYIHVLDNIIDDIQIASNLYDSVVGYFIANHSLNNYDLEKNIKLLIKKEINNANI